jgi:hypothetical protein
METNGNTTIDPVPAAITPEELVAQLRAYRERIPDYGQLTTAASRQRHRVAFLKKGFVVASINAVGASDTVQTAVGQMPAELQDSRPISSGGPPSRMSCARC